MKRLMLAAVPAVMIGGALAATATPASAVGGTLFCQVISNHTGSSGGSEPGSCGPSVADSSYVLDYGVAGGSAPYSWSVPGGHTVIGGCNSSSPFCDITARGVTHDQEITVSVSGISATAFIPAVCGSEFC